MLHKKYLLLEKKACEEILFYFLFTAFISHFKSRLLHILKASKFAFPPQTLHRICTVYHLKEKIGREMRQAFFTHLVCVHRRISSKFRRWWKKQQSSFLLEAQNVHSSHIQLKSQGLKKRSGRLAAPKKKALNTFCINFLIPLPLNLSSRVRRSPTETYEFNFLFFSSSPVGGGSQEGVPNIGKWTTCGGDVKECKFSAINTAKSKCLLRTC